jgi:hypothetical protein
MVYSDGGEEQLVHVTENLEKLHALLARLYLQHGRGLEPPRLQVVLFGSAGAMHALNLHNPLTEEGPFAKPFAEQRYYDPRPDGAVLALPRVNQVIEMNTSKAHSADCEDIAQEGDDCIGMKIKDHPSLLRSWEAILYGSYAQHLILHYTPARLPRWYYDGIGALFSTVVFKSDGSVEYGRPPAEGYRAALRSYGRLDAASVLTGRYLREHTQMEWTPYHAGLLTHFFVLSKLKGGERSQFAAYMTAIARGKSMAEAAQAFGTMKWVRRDVLGYAERKHEYAKTVKSPAAATPEVTPLSYRDVETLMASLSAQP